MVQTFSESVRTVINITREAVFGLNEYKPPTKIR